jgi:hypothetical protein
MANPESTLHSLSFTGPEPSSRNDRVGRIDGDKTDARPLDAVIAHVSATMKDEKPWLLCLAPKVTRKIPFSTRP